MDNSSDITYFAETDARNRRIKFGIKAEDRLRHVYSIGKTGMGKSTMLENMAIQDIQNGNGLAFLDPHGKTADLLLDYIPEHRVKDVIYFAPFDTEFPICFNVMEDVGEERRHLVVSGLMSAFEKIWVDAWSARMAYILQNTLAALLEYPDATMLGINRMLSDKAYRLKVVNNISDPTIKSFWTEEFAKYTERFAAEATPAIQNKVGQFTSNPLIRNIIGQPTSSFDIRKIMDEKKILIVNLSKGLVGENNANLLGSMLVTKIYLAAMSRADVDPKELKNLPNFYLYVDEFQSFANKSFADILSEARKYKLSLNITHQYIEQMAEEVRAAVFGNVGTLISFRVGSFDAEVLEKEFAPVFTMEDIVNLGFAQIYLRLMIDQVASQPFSATTLPPIPKPAVSYRDQVMEMSRKVYARPKAEVEAAIRKFHEAEIPPRVAASSPKLPEVQKSFPRTEAVRERPARTPEQRPPQPQGEKREFSTEISRPSQPVQSSRPSQGTQPVEKGISLGNAIAEALKQKSGPNPAASVHKDSQRESQSTQTERPHSHQPARHTDHVKKPDISIPLHSLKNIDGNKNKNASPQNLNALRDAVSRAQNQINPQRQAEPKATTTRPVEPPTQPAARAGEEKQKTPKHVKEVPEEVLMKILKGE